MLEFMEKVNPLSSLCEETRAEPSCMSQESVLAAQTKDKKRVNESEIEVHIAWRSCLYVTNFPESFDKPAVEKLFEKVSNEILSSQGSVELTLRTFLLTVWCNL